MKLNCNLVLLWSPLSNHHQLNDNSNKNDALARQHKSSLETCKDRKNNTIYHVIPSSAFWKRSTEITSENLIPNSLSNKNHNNSNNSNNNDMTIEKLMKCILIPVIGVPLGLITLMPNMMMIDSETTIAISATYIGIFASLSFVIGGILGAIYQTWYGLLRIHSSK